MAGAIGVVSTPVAGASVIGAGEVVVSAGAVIAGVLFTSTLVPAEVEGPELAENTR